MAPYQISIAKIISVIPENLVLLTEVNNSVPNLHISAPLWSVNSKQSKLHVQPPHVSDHDHLSQAP